MSEDVIMQLIVHAGNARSAGMEAIQHAKEGRYEAARAALQEAGEELARAHQVQTALIQREAAGERVNMSLLMVHAQDHMMNAMTVKDLAAELVELYERLAAGGRRG
ncbi:MAG: PTS lactose/cellobiose transporter subunit IIA [Bacillota bacterium]|nr:MAG: PTS lactose/cellobiose transporter subunit IIA [Bacillota bacterium]